jgi:hypothetical protein
MQTTDPGLRRRIPAIRRDRSRARFDFADKNTLFGLNTFSRRAGTRALPWQTTLAEPWGCVDPWSQPPHNFGVKPVNDPIAPDLHEFHRSFLTRLKSNRSAGCYIQTITPGRFPIELEGFVHFIEMKMRTNLDRSIAGIC